MDENEPKPEKESQVSMKETIIAKRIEELFVVIDSLESRLSDILQPLAPSPPTTTKTDTPALVALAGALDSYGNKLRGAISRIADIINRCEL